MFLFFFFVAWGASCESSPAKGNWAGLGSCADKGRQSDRIRGSGADSVYKDLLGISFKRSGRTKCSPFTSSAGGGRGRTCTMYGKGLGPNSYRFFTYRRSSWLRSLSMISSNRLMQSSLAFSTQLTNRPRLRLPTNHQENRGMSIEKTTLTNMSYIKNETDLGTRETDSYEKEALESQASRTTGP